MKYGRDYKWVMDVVDPKKALELLEDLTFRGLKPELIGNRDLRKGEVISWFVSIWMTKQEWITLRGELYPVYGDYVNFYTSMNVNNGK